MAKARKVVADQNSEELDQLRRTVHSLMIILENVGTNLAAAIDPADVGTALEAAIATGVDSDTSGGYVPTGIEIVGVDPTPKHPRRPKGGKIVDLDPSDL